MRVNKRWMLAVLIAFFVGLLAVMPVLASAKRPSQTTEAVSQRQWMRENGQMNGEAPGIWVWRVTTNKYPDWPGRGKRQADPTKPETCVGCHAWVENATITQYGFTNAWGVTPGVTDLDISPKKLLDSAVHAEYGSATTYDNAHAEIYDHNGCAACHTQHGPVSNFGCANCHASTEEGIAFLHGTHATLIEAEMPLADPVTFNAGKTSCGYCHASANPGVGNASCYNCHLSGHKPRPVPYWKATQ